MMRRFEYFAPQSLEETIALLKEHGDGVKLVAGGTDVLPQMKEAGLHPSAVVSLHAVEDLRGIEFDQAQGLRIGAGADMAGISSFPAIRERYSALADGAGVLGSVQTRNMATIGGNIANAAPSADTAPPLVVLDAEAEIAGPAGQRREPVADLFAGPGETNLSSSDVLIGFRLPAPPPRTGSAYLRHTPREAMDIATVGVGVRVTLDAKGDTISEARICLGAVAPTPIRAPEAEAALSGQTPSPELLARATALAQEAARPITDARASGEFRRHLVGVLTRRCLDIALERASAT